MLTWHWQWKRLFQGSKVSTVSHSHGEPGHRGSSWPGWTPGPWAGQSTDLPGRPGLLPYPGKGAHWLLSPKRVTPCLLLWGCRMPWGSSHSTLEMLPSPRLPAGPQQTRWLRAGGRTSLLPSSVGNGSPDPPNISFSLVGAWMGSGASAATPLIPPGGCFVVCLPAS